MSYWSRISPRGAIGDIVELWRSPQPYRWQVLAVSVTLTFTLMLFFIPESQRKAPARPEVTYITTWQDGRTDAEIIASNLENQARKEEAAAELEARIERRKALYRALGRATGLDVDEMERKIAAEEAAAEAQRAEQQRQLAARQQAAAAAEQSAAGE
jgi:hypothetical protein